jgi:prophage regulatory protein
MMRLLNFDQLKPEKGVPYCRDHLRRLVDNGTFPAPVKVGEKRIGWVEREIDDWLAAKIRARDAAAE